MWIVKLVTFIEYHPLPTLCALLILLGLTWLIRRELKRPSYRQQSDLERLLNGFEPPTELEGDAEESGEDVHLECIQDIHKSHE